MPYTWKQRECFYQHSALIFVSGFFPDKWTEGVIIPLHKKGSVNDVNNYRGVTVVSCFSKLFTTI